MSLISITYCTVAEVQRFLSADGVLAFADHDEDGVSDTDVVEDCINQATEEIDMYAGGRYDQTGLASSTLVTRWCVTIASYFLCMRRGNPVPESLLHEFERLLAPNDGLLIKIADGTYNLPRIANRADMRPSWSNLKIDRRWPNSKVRVTRSNSNDSPTTLTRDFSTELPITDG